MADIYTWPDSHGTPTSFNDPEKAYNQNPGDYAYKEFSEEETAGMEFFYSNPIPSDLIAIDWDNDESGTFSVYAQYANDASWYFIGSDGSFPLPADNLIVGIKFEYTADFDDDELRVSEVRCRQIGPVPAVGGHYRKIRVV